MLTFFILCGLKTEAFLLTTDLDVDRLLVSCAEARQYTSRRLVCVNFPCFTKKKLLLLTKLRSVLFVLKLKCRKKGQSEVF